MPFRFIIFLFLFIITESILPRSLKGRVSYEYYRFQDNPVIHGFAKIPAENVLISSFCIRRKGKETETASCDAWSPLDKIQDGSIKEIFTTGKRLLPDMKNPKSIGYYICQHTGGNVDTDWTEKGRFQKAPEPTEFCVFPDGSKLGMNSILFQILGK